MTSSPLAEWLKRNKRDPIEAMNWLQDNGFVTDNAVFADEIAWAEGLHAIGYLKARDYNEQRN